MATARKTFDTSSLRTTTTTAVKADEIPIASNMVIATTNTGDNKGKRRLVIRLTGVMYGGFRLKRQSVLDLLDATDDANQPVLSVATHNAIVANIENIDD